MCQGLPTLPMPLSHVHGFAGRAKRDPSIRAGGMPQGDAKQGLQNLKKTAQPLSKHGNKLVAVKHRPKVSGFGGASNLPRIRTKQSHSDIHHAKP